MGEKPKKSVGIKLCSNGETEILTFEKSKISLSEMQEVVSGNIEVVYLSNEALMIVNEEGKLNSLPFNELATHLFQCSTLQEDFIVGDVLIIHNKYVD